MREINRGFYPVRVMICLSKGENKKREFPCTAC